MYFKHNFQTGPSPRKPIQRGEGIASFLSGIFRQSVPIIKKVLTSDTTKKIADTGLNLGADVSHDNTRL